MITKKQWSNFCMDIRLAKSWGLEPHINGDRVVAITEDIIRTKNHINNNIIVYKYGESNKEHQSMDYLYGRVELKKVSLLNIKPIFKYIASKKMFE